MKPKKIKVGPQDYSVNYTDSLNKFARDGEGLYGLCSLTDKKIYIDNSCHIDVQRQILLHEILHAVWFNAGLESDGEESIRHITSVLLGVLKDNPKLLTFLLGEE